MPSDRNVPHSPTLTDLDDADNQIQARHELHRARDFGGDAELAAWARKWGESALQRRGSEADGLEAERVELDDANVLLGTEKTEAADAIKEVEGKLTAFLKAADELSDFLSESASRIRNL